MNASLPSQERTVITDGALLRAKALASPARVELLRLLAAMDEPATAAMLAPHVGLHRTAVGRHLTHLRAAGLVVTLRLSSGRRGRPQIGYVAVPPSDPPERPYQDLAQMLAVAVRSGRSARETGRMVGARSIPASPEPLQALILEAGRLGFEPMVRASDGAGTDIVLRVCPFAELAQIDPATVCQLHLGLAEGLADRIGGMTVEGLHLADPSTGGCTLAVRIG